MQRCGQVFSGNTGGSHAERGLVYCFGMRLSGPSLLALFCLVAGPAGAACAPPRPPQRIVQQATIPPDGPLARAEAAPGAEPRLVLLNRACHTLLTVGFGGREAAGSDSLLRFRIASIGRFPEPLLIASLATPGGSDTGFETQLIGRVHGHWRALMPKPAASLLEGGVFVGNLGGKLGPGVAVWSMVWSRGEAHVSPHRYALERMRWTGTRFVSLPKRVTRHKYTTAAAALQELRVRYTDVTRTFPDFDKLR